jgi:hypothetical protein
MSSNGTGGLPANIGNMGQALATSIAAAGTSGEGDLYMKFVKGEWVYGAEETEVQESSKWAINPAGCQHGYTAWGSEERGNEGKNVGERMVPATTPMPLEAALPEVNGDWSKCIAVQMRCTNGDDEGIQVLFKSNSHGARKAYASILQDIVERIQSGVADVVPLVELGADSYKHKKYGKIYTPQFEVVGWATMDGEQAEEPEAIEEQAEAPEPEPAAEEKPRRRRRKAS